MGDKREIVVSDDDEEVREHDEVMSKPALLRDQKEEGPKKHDVESDEDLPDWLPDGWTMEVYRAADGTKNLYYTSPISDYTFTSQSEVMKYLFSGEEERILQSKECAEEIAFQKAYEWLPKGWEMEIRAGGKNMDKMYKFYIEPRVGVRFQSKDDVLLYLKESKISNCDTNGECDTSSNDNILAKVDLHPTGLPRGWIRELVFRKTKYGSVRRDPYYTDPASRYTFRTVKSALSYLETGDVPKWAFIQKTSVHDIYSFEKCADMHEFLRGRLAGNRRCYRKRASRRQQGKSLQIDQEGDSDRSEDSDTSFVSDSLSEEEDDSINSMKGGSEEATSSRTNHRYKP